MLALIIPMVVASAPRWARGVKFPHSPVHQYFEKVSPPNSLTFKPPKNDKKPHKKLTKKEFCKYDHDTNSP